jgi:hypothetical protein
MENGRKLKIVLVFAFLWVIIWETPACGQGHIKDLDGVRTALTEFGDKMPEVIKNADGKDVRTLERLYEINTYAFTTVEAYFKMMQIAISTEGDINGDIVGILNGWLEFIRRYCRADIKYFNEAMASAQSPAMIDLIQKAKKNMADLMEITRKAIDENKAMLSK